MQHSPKPKTPTKSTSALCSANRPLFFSHRAGSCWLGIPQPTKDAADSSNLEFIILMAFGNPKETLYRTSTAEFKRKPLTETTNIMGADELLEPTRLAPSAVNNQNWYFTGNTTAILRLLLQRAGFLRSKVGGNSTIQSTWALPFAICSLPQNTAAGTLNSPLTVQKIKSHLKIWSTLPVWRSKSQANGNGRL